MPCSVVKYYEICLLHDIGFSCSCAPVRPRVIVVVAIAVPRRAVESLLVLLLLGRYYFLVLVVGRKYT